MNDDDRRLLRDWADQLSPTLDENYKLVENLDRVLNRTGIVGGSNS